MDKTAEEFYDCSQAEKVGANPCKKLTKKYREIDQQQKPLHKVYGTPFFYTKLATNSKTFSQRCKERKKKNVSEYNLKETKKKKRNYKSSK